MGFVVPSSAKPLSPLSHQSVGNLKETIDEFKMSNSYATNGDILTAQALGFGPTGRIYNCQVTGKSSNTNRYEVIHATRGPVAQVKIRAIVNATGAEVANTTDLSAEILTIQARGKY